MPRRNISNQQYPMLYYNSANHLRNQIKRMKINDIYLWIPLLLFIKNIPMKNLWFIFLITLTVSVQSCLKDDGNNPVYVRMEITDVDMPDTFQLGATYEIRINYLRPDGCTHLQGFDSYPVEQTTR